MSNLTVTVRTTFVKLVWLGVSIATTLSGVVAFGNSDLSDVNKPEFQSTVAALAVARHSRSLADAASTRTHADMSPEAMAKARASIEFDAEQINHQLDLLANAGQPGAATRIRQLLNELLNSANQLEDGRAQFAQSLRDSQNRRQQLVAETSWQLLPAAVASEDDLFHRIISETRTTDHPSSQLRNSVSVENLLLYNRLALLKQQIDQGYIALEVATRQTDSEFIGTVEEAVNLAMYQLRENVDALSDVEYEELDPKLIVLARDLVDEAYGETNLIELMKTRLRLDDREARLADNITRTSSALQSEVHEVLEKSIDEIRGEETERETANALLAALAVSQHASRTNSNSSGETTANTQASDLPEMRTTIDRHMSGMRQGLATLSELGYGSESARLLLQIDHMTSNTEGILNGRAELAEALQSAARERAQLRSFVDYQLEPAVVSSLDNQLYYMLTGRSESRAEGSIESDHLSHDEFLRFWHLASVNDSIFGTFSGLIIAIIMTDATWIAVGEERFNTSSHRLAKSIDYLSQAGGAEVDSQLVPLARQFIGFGNGESNVFDSLRHRLPLVAIERELIQANQHAFAELQVGIDSLIDSIIREADSSS
ncbi:MAG: hypothetical protein OXG05_00445 [Gammaproteobacteria bacterium]|nr:hypothetical protein [Gammaproteobacteria bacterium]